MPPKPQGFVQINGKTYEAAVFARDLHERRGVQFTFSDGTDSAIFLNNGTVYAVANICPHQHSSSISDGMIQDGCVICPLHGWAFSLDTGKCTDSNAALDTYDVREINGIIYVETPPDYQPAWMKW